MSDTLEEREQEAGSVAAMDIAKRPPRLARASATPMPGIAQAIAKILDGYKDRRIRVDKCAELIARHMDAQDRAGAAEVRAALARYKDGPPSPGLLRSLSTTVESVADWCEPTDLAEELVLDSAAANRFQRLVEELAQAPRILAAGIDAPTRVLFSGPSGTGKTLAARWLGGRLNLPVAIVRLDRVTDSHMGVTAQNMAKAMGALDACPSILFLDEIDGLCGRRDSGGNDVAERARITSALFQQLDALPARQIVVAATNFRDHIDPALVRRLPCEVVFKLPNDDAREAMLRRWWGNVDYAGGALYRVVRETAGCSGAATRSLAMAVARAALLAGSAIAVEHVQSAVEDSR